MKVDGLASSSAGNCYILSFEGMPPLMVECGIPYRSILRRCNKLNLDLSQIKNCLVTHAHGDHSLAAKDLSKRGVTIWANEETLKLCKVMGGCLENHKPILIQEGMKVMAFPVDHDIEGAVGFVIKTKKECVIFVNDHKKWDVNLGNFKPDYVFIECNYNQRIVYAQYNELTRISKLRGISPAELKENNIKLAQVTRNIKSHCSLNGTIHGLQKLNLDNCKAIFLMHLSNRYANEYLMKNEVYRHTGIKTFVCGREGGTK